MSAVPTPTDARVNVISNISLIRAAKLVACLGISKATLYRWLADPKLNFPRPISLGPKVVAWRVVEVEAFLTRRTGA